MNGKRKTIAFLVVLMLVAGTLFAQRNNAQELRLGVQTNGNISNGGEAWYRVTLDQASILVVEVYSNDFDTYLEIYDSNNKLLGENDDFGDSTDSKIELIGERRSSYFIKVRSYDNGGGGSFRILATTKPIPQATELRFGRAANGNISRSDSEQWFSVRPTRAGVIMIDVTSDDIDSYLEVYNSTYSLIGSDDDGGEGLNSRLFVPVEANQTYLLKVSSYSGTGRFTINARMFIEAN